MATRESVRSHGSPHPCSEGPLSPANTGHWRAGRVSCCTTDLLVKDWLLLNLVYFVAVAVQLDLGFAQPSPSATGSGSPGSRVLSPHAQNARTFRR